MATVLPVFNPIEGIPEAIRGFRDRQKQKALQQKQLQDAQLLNRFILQRQGGGLAGLPPGIGGAGGGITGIPAGLVPSGSQGGQEVPFPGIPGLGIGGGQLAGIGGFGQPDPSILPFNPANAVSPSTLPGVTGGRFNPTPLTPNFQTAAGAGAFGNFLAQQPTQFQQQQSAADLAKTRAETAKFGRPVVITPSQQISQKKLDRINQLQSKIESGNATERESSLLDKMLAGVSPVQISFGKSTAAERTALAETEANIDALDNLETLFKKPGVQTGPVVGRVNPLTGLAGLTSPEQEDFMAASASFKNFVIQEITGAQMSEAEVGRIEGQIPLVTDPPARWKAKMKLTRRNLKVIQKRRQQVLEKSGITNPLTGQQGQINAVNPEFESISDAELLKIIGGQ